MSEEKKSDKNELKLLSTAFGYGTWIPDCYSGYGENRSPELLLEGIDKAAVSMAVTMDDKSHPLFPNYNHWVAWNLLPSKRIPEHLPKGKRVLQPVYLEQGLAYGRHCYRGPKPPFNWMHEYVFTVYILDIKLEISTDSRKKELLAAMEGHILQKAIYMGKYQKTHDG